MLHLLANGRPMTDFCSHELLLQSLNVLDLPTKHWSETSGWDIAYATCAVVLKRTKEMIAKADYVSLSADEVTSVDNQQWLSSHIYCVKNWQRVPILLSLSRVTKGCGASNLKHMILSMALWHGGMSDHDLQTKLVCFGADGASVFQGSRSGVCAKLQGKHAPFMIKIHCMAHRTNPAVQAIGNFPLVKGLENLCQNLNAFLGHSPKRALQFQVLAESLQLEALKILRNVKTRWISIYDPIIRIRDSYQTLVVQMAIESNRKATQKIESKKGAAAQKNLDILCDLGTFLSIPCILPLLTLLHDLITFAQGRDVYICDYVAAVEMCLVDLQCRYVDPESWFCPLDFPQFTEFIENRSYCMLQEWVTDLNSGVEFLSYCIGEHTYPCHIIHATSKAKIPVTHELYDQIVSSVKRQCTEAVTCLIAELKGRFPDSELMLALGIVFPQFWRFANCDSTFMTHVAGLKKHFGVLRYVTNLEGDFVQVPDMLSCELLDSQAGIFRTTMKNNWSTALGEPRDVNPLSKLWQVLETNALLKLRMSEYFKLADIAVCCVIGSVEDERTFSNLAFIKSRIRNRLTTNLDCVVCMFAQNFYTVQDFPYEEAITNWLAARDKRSTRD